MLEVAVDSSVVVNEEVAVEVLGRLVAELVPVEVNVVNSQARYAPLRCNSTARFIVLAVRSHF
jgi:hypothetical protein